MVVGWYFSFKREGKVGCLCQIANLLASLEKENPHFRVIGCSWFSLIIVVWTFVVIGLIPQVQIHFDLCWQKKKMILSSLVFEMGFCRAAALPKDYGGNCIQMRLSYSPFAPIFLYFIEWMDYSCTDILPNYLGLLHIIVYKVGCCSFFYAFLLIFCCPFFFFFGSKLSFT